MNYIYIPELVDLRKSFRVFNSANVHSRISEHADVFFNKEGLYRRLVSGNCKNIYSWKFWIFILKKIWKLKALLQLLTNYLKNTFECGVYV